jgi:hypothetical protein
MKFLHFKRQDGTKVNSAKIPGFQLYGEHYDDIDFKLTIINEKIKIELIVDSYMTQDEIDDINEDIKHNKINWDNGYEFVDYYDLLDGSSVMLIADSNSSVFNSVTSQKNLLNRTYL